MNDEHERTFKAATVEVAELRRLQQDDGLKRAELAALKTELTRLVDELGQ